MQIRFGGTFIVNVFPKRGPRLLNVLRNSYGYKTQNLDKTDLHCISCKPEQDDPLKNNFLKGHIPFVYLNGRTEGMLDLLKLFGKITTLNPLQANRRSLPLTKDTLTDLFNPFEDLRSQQTGIIVCAKDVIHENLKDLRISSTNILTSQWSPLCALEKLILLVPRPGKGSHVNQELNKMNVPFMEFNGLPEPVTLLGYEQSIVRLAAALENTGVKLSKETGYEPLITAIFRLIKPNA